MQNLLRQGGMQPPKLINTYKFWTKKGLKLSILAHQMQNFLWQGKRATPPNLNV